MRASNKFVLATSSIALTTKRYVLGFGKAVPAKFAEGNVSERAALRPRCGKSSFAPIKKSSGSYSSTIGFARAGRPAGEKFCEILRRISNGATAAKPKP